MPNLFICVLRRPPEAASLYRALYHFGTKYLSIDICMPVWYHMTMKRTALFLKEEQLNKLLKLSEKTGAPVAELVRRAVDGYLKKRAKELK